MPKKILVLLILTFIFCGCNNNKNKPVLPPGETLPGIGKRYSFFTAIGPVRTSTNDPTPYAVVVEMVIGYDPGDKSCEKELTSKVDELRDFVKNYFHRKPASDLVPENEARIKTEIIELLNTRVLNKTKVRIITFNAFDVLEM